MQKWSQFLARVREYNPDADSGFFERLRLFFQDLPSLDPVQPEAPSPDPLSIGAILADLRLDSASLAAGMVIGRLPIDALSLHHIRKALGEDVAYLLEGTTRISLVSAQARSERQAEEFRKMVLALAKDIRVVLIRLALCLQQLRAAEGCAHPGQPLERMTRQVLDIYAPIAHRLGIYWIKNELEDQAFKLSHPEVCRDLKSRVLLQRKGGADVVRKVIAILEGLLDKHGITGRVSGREKHLYSVWTKLQRKDVDLDQLHDLIAYRIIVDDPAACYQTLGMIHGEFSPIPGRFKDYLALPKSNGYQSLHTACIGPFGNRIEIQIRTKEMHNVAESGVAAHWNYKSGEIGEGREAHLTGYAWLKELLEIHRGAEDPEQFLENVKIDLFPDEIYLFTPAGEIKTLPAGASPVDFAYAIHSQVGDRCRGCKVNGRMVPLRTQLKTGDTVEILTGKERHPHNDWLQFVATGKAKYCISRWIKARQREQLVACGRQMLEREGRKAARKHAITERVLQKAAETAEIASVDELLFRIGTGRLSATSTVNRMFPDSAPAAERAARETVEDWRQARAGEGTLTLSGLLDNVETRAGGCCAPVPGDAIVGIVTTGRGITIHRQACPNLAAFTNQPERRIDQLDWREDDAAHHTARLKAMVANRKKVLMLVSEAVAEAKGTILEARFRDRDREPCTLILEVEVTGLAHLARVRQRVGSLALVYGVERILG